MRKGNGWKNLMGVVSLVLTACVSLPTPQERVDRINRQVQAQGWQAWDIPSQPFRLRAYLPQQVTPAQVLTVYIEGDGLAWLSPSDPSSDPTPIHPLALDLAMAQHEGNAAYLGRPCQYGGAESVPCGMAFWTNRRFAPEVVAAINQGVEALKQRFQARQVILVGYSGGGAVAALVAARRGDVLGLVTVAGNLDPQAWAQWHRLQPLSGSLNPVAAVPALAQVPQWHFVGAKDDNIPPFLVASFAARFPENRQPHVVTVPGFDHQCCWAEHWPELWRSFQPKVTP